VTAPADDPLRALAELIGRVGQTLRADDTAAARAEAAAQVDQLRELVASVDRARPAGSPAVFDLARVGEALRVIARSLQMPTSANEAEVRQVLAELQAALGPLAGGAPARDEAAEREHYRLQARAAMDDYFREHPIKPFKP
jgi:hypothetical protein